MTPRRPSPAMVVAGLALFVSLSGTSYAISKLPKNSVTSAAIKDGTIASADLGNGVVTREKLASGVAVAGPRGPRGAEGPAGPQGPAAASTAYVDRATAQVSPPLQTPNGTPATVVALDLPRGAFTLVFSAHAYVDTGAVTFLNCALVGPGGALTATTTALGSSDAPRNAQQAALAMTDALTLAAPGKVSVTCQRVSGSGDVRVVDGRLVATPVANVETQ